MKKDLSVLLYILVASSGCSEQSVRQCAYGKGGSVMITKKISSALDGNDVEICTLLPSGKCSAYNHLSMLRPLHISVEILRSQVYILQSGGSVQIFSTDPIGLLDADYKTSTPLSYIFDPRDRGGPPFSLIIDGQPTSLDQCKT